MAFLACFLLWQQWLEGWAQLGLWTGAPTLHLTGIEVSRYVNFLVSCLGLLQSIPRGQVESKTSHDLASEDPEHYFHCMLLMKGITKTNPDSRGDE